MRQHGGLLLVHAHPDDECVGTGGLIARSVAEGRRVDLVTCTGGEEGEIHDPRLDPEEAQPRLVAIRREELECSLSALRGDGSGGGTLRLHLLGYRDSGMDGSDSNAHPEAFWQADLEEATERLVRIVREARPAVMVTYDANGLYGHPDHVNAHRVAVAAWEAAADPARFPATGAPCEVAKLYEIAFSREGWFELMTLMRERGIPLPWGFDEEADGSDARPESEPEPEPEPEPDSFGTAAAEISATVDVSDYSAQKRASMVCHRTQRQDMGWLLDLPDDLASRALSPEHFVLARWRGHDPSSPPVLGDTSLFDGLG